MCFRACSAWRPIRDLVGLTDSKLNPAPRSTNLQRIVFRETGGRVDRRDGLEHVNRRGRFDSELHLAGLSFTTQGSACAGHFLVRFPPVRAVIVELVDSQERTSG